MHSRPAPTLGLIFLVAMAALSCAEPPAPKASLLLITVDGLDPKRLAMHGGETATPHLEALAEAGHAWNDAWTTCPMTRPAVATLLTGTTPERHGVRDDLLTALPEGFPTLAAALTDSGYATAAFPDSSFLGFDSGVLQGFELVDDAPFSPVTLATWIPVSKPRLDLGARFADWMQSAQSRAPMFVWIHFSQPLLEVLLPAPEHATGIRSKKQIESPDGIETFDAQLGLILDALAAAGRDPQTWVFVTGTMGDVTGGESGLRGPGFSLDAGALGVPLVVRPPAGETLEPSEAAAWLPDVAATLAAIGGVTLPDAVGIDLRSDPPDSRTLFAWSAALNDQLGWEPLRSARSGPRQLVEGDVPPRRRLDGAAIDTDEPAWSRLEAELTSRPWPAAPAVPLDSIRPFLAARGLEVEPVASSGRAFGPDETRRDVVVELWAARNLLQRQNREGIRRLDRVLALDPQALGALLLRGQIPALEGSYEGENDLGRAAELYPTQPEILHWYAHAIWPQDHRSAAELLETILPFKTEDGDVLYDLACAKSLDGELTDSERYLRLAIESGFRQWAHMDRDPDLRNLRRSRRFAAIMRDYRQ